MHQRFNKILFFAIFIAFFLNSSCFGLTLRESIEIAMENNPDILAQGARISGSESRLGQVISTFYPTISIDGGYGRSYRTPIEYTYFPTAESTATFEAPFIGVIEISPEVAVAPITLESYRDEPQTARNIGVAFTQILYSGGRRLHMLEIAKAHLRITEGELVRKGQLLTYRVIEAYYNVVLRKKMLELALESERVAEVHLDQARNYFGLGRISNADLLRAKIRLAQEKFNKIEIQNKLDKAKMSLNTVLGRGIDEEIEVEDAGSESGPASMPGSEEALLLALENRPEWEAYGLTKEIGASKVRIERAGFFPQLALRGSISKSYLDPDTPPENQTEGILRSDSWLLFGAFSWNIFDSFRTKNRVWEAMASLEEIKTHEKRIKNRISSEIKEARLYFNAAKAKVPLAQEQVDLAGENLRQARESYRRGVAGNIEFLEAQETLNKAKTDLLRSATDLAIAKAKFNLAVGIEIFALY
jgi:outer membrane protein TolC